MKVVVIGGTGHIGSYLVPRLWDAGHEVVAVTRGQREPYRRHPAWEQVGRVQIDRAEAERAGVFGQRIADLRPEVVIDRFLPWEEWKRACVLPESDVETTYSHLAHGQCCSIEKGQRLLGYQPRYTSFEAVRQAVEWLTAHGEIEIGQ